MAKPRHIEQKKELETLLASVSISIPELCERAGIKPDTFRKYLGGYQPAGKSTLVAIRQVIAFEKERMARATNQPLPAQAMREDSVKYAVKLNNLPAAKMDLAKKLIDELSVNCPTARGSCSEDIVQAVVDSALSDLKGSPHRTDAKQAQQVAEPPSVYRRQTTRQGGEPDPGSRKS